MSGSLIRELIGYTGSALVLVSLTRTSIIKLRKFGLAGAVFMVAYSLLIAAYPITLVNVVIVFIHLFFLRELRTKRNEYFKALVVRPENRYLAYFLEFFSKEISRFQPGFTYRPGDKTVAAFILRDTVPAGLFIGRNLGDGSIDVELDFAIPQYRDFKIGEYLFSSASGVFEGFDRARSDPGEPDHAQYLERMGFTPAMEAGGRPYYVKDLRHIRTG